MSFRPRLILASPPEFLVWDEEISCPYIPGLRAKMPMRVPMEPLNRKELDQRLQNGDRRQGINLYGMQCSTCKACEQLRIDVNRFIANKTQRRIYKKGLECFEIEFHPVSFSKEKLHIYNRHRLERNLGKYENEIDFRNFLEQTCCETFEIQYRINKELIGVAVVDRAEHSLNAVYFYFNPDYTKFSPGTFSILTQVEVCKIWGLQYLYLGTYNRQNIHLKYKDNFHPHEKFINGKWISTP